MENIKDGQLKNWHRTFDFALILPYNMFIELISDDPTSPPSGTWFTCYGEAF